MAVVTYTLDQYVEALRRIAAESQDDRVIMEGVCPLSQRLALDRSWLDSRFYEGDPEQGFGVYLLHQELNHRLAVFAVSWLPGGGAAPIPRARPSPGDFLNVRLPSSLNHGSLCSKAGSA